MELFSDAITVDDIFPKSCSSDTDQMLSLRKMNHLNSMDNHHNDGNASNNSIYYHNHHSHPSHHHHHHHHHSSGKGKGRYLEKNPQPVKKFCCGP